MELALKLKYFDSEVHAPSHYPIIYCVVVYFIEVYTQISILTEFTQTYTENFKHPAVFIFVACSWHIKISQ